MGVKRWTCAHNVRGNSLAQRGGEGSMDCIMEEYNMMDTCVG